MNIDFLLNNEIITSIFNDNISFFISSLISFMIGFAIASLKNKQYIIEYCKLQLLKRQIKKEANRFRLNKSFAFQNIIHILFRISCDKLPNNDFIIISYHDIIGKEPVKDYYITFKSKCIKSKKYEPLDKQLVDPNLINIIDKTMNKSKKLESIDFCIILLDDKSNILYKLVKYY